MMKLKKSMKNRSAVSPVIATILMVAITVVLAAVLYVMVMGFGGGDSSSITGSFTSKVKEADKEVLQFGAFTPEIGGEKLKMVVAVTGPTGYIATSGTFVWASNSWTSSATGLGPVDVTKGISLNDLGNDGIISNGDKAVITHTSTTSDDVPAGTYTITVTMLNANSGDSVNSIQYTWNLAAT
jgi:flagellin-like protein